jgi:hypothetical protein
VIRFVRPEVSTLTLEDGVTLTVRKRLNAGQQREVFTRMYTAGIDGKLRVNPLLTGIGIITAYLLDWNVVDADGQPVPIRGASVEELEDIVNSLEPPSFTAIKDAIEAHEAKMVAERAAEKNIHGGESSASVTSPSPFVAAGASSGSAS